MQISSGIFAAAQFPKIDAEYFIRVQGNSPNTFMKCAFLFFLTKAINQKKAIQSSQSDKFYWYIAHNLPKKLN